MNSEARYILSILKAEISAREKELFCEKKGNLSRKVGRLEALRNFKTKLKI